MTSDVQTKHSTQSTSTRPAPSSRTPGSDLIPTAIYGGSGYVAGELLRVLSFHPTFEPVAVYSTSQAGELVTSAFPHLAGTKLDGLRFSAEELDTRKGPFAVFTATPHGAAAPIVAKLLAAREEAARSEKDAKRDQDFHVVDLSADFRLADPDEWAAIYGKPHPAPELLPRFTSGVPEHVETVSTPHAAQPGCFTTAVVCAAWPFFKLGLVEGDVFASAITGSSGSGKTPAANTHHPDRHATLYAYNALAHRHESEMRHLIGAARPGREPAVEFVPHSGPFVRGIHATLRMTLRRELADRDGSGDLADIVDRVNELHANAAKGSRPFVVASTAMPKLTEVVGTNRCRLGLAGRGRTLVVTSVLDNLTKGAAGGAVQWMNRLFGLPESTGLELPGLGWY